MGREARAVASWDGRVAEVTALLESDHVRLRGDLRLRVERSDVSNIAATDDLLVLETSQGVLTLELGAAEAARWRDKFLSPPPSLADKLGIGPDHPVFVLGSTDDPPLLTALGSNTTSDPTEAALLLAIIRDHIDLDAAIDLAQRHSPSPIWCVYPKGQAEVGDSLVRAQLRAAGFIDSKSCAVSDRLTATRYRLRS